MKDELETLIDNLQPEFREVTAVDLSKQPQPGKAEKDKEDDSTLHLQPSGTGRDSR